MSAVANRNSYTNHHHRKGVLFAAAQPVVATNNMRTHGVELLARMRQPNGAVLTPDKFMSGRDPQYDLQMLWNACCFIQTLPDSGIPLDTLAENFFISFNLHPNTIVAHSPDRLTEIVQLLGIPPELVQFELLEHPYPGMTGDLIVDRLKTFRDRGHLVVMDDYTDTNAQNRRLRALFEAKAITGLKLDRPLIDDLMEGRKVPFKRLLRRCASGDFKIVAEQTKNRKEAAHINQIFEDLGIQNILHQSFAFGYPTPFESPRNVIVMHRQCGGGDKPLNRKAEHLPVHELVA
ncbi:MAG: EAL domain-containing protein [Rhodospirillales bacterium]|nr:EAL domain-containing protein [Rhodospirillales bacterium]